MTRNEERARQLLEEIERNEGIASLTEEQSKAVRSELDKMMDAQGRRASRVNLIQNAGFFVAGLIASGLVFR